MNRENFPKPNATCVICGRKYYRCSRCIELRNMGIEAWKLKCDTFNCFSVHCLLENANKGNFDEDMFKELISISLPEERHFTKSVLEQIDSLKEKYGGKSQKESPINLQAIEQKLHDSNETSCETLPVESNNGNTGYKRKKTNRKYKNVK